MTPDQAFLVASKHLLRQGRRCLDDQGTKLAELGHKPAPAWQHYARCHHKGLWCPVGILMVSLGPDRVSTMGGPWRTKRVQDGLREAGVNTDDPRMAQLLDDLQLVHDQAYIVTWGRMLASMAITEGYPVDAELLSLLEAARDAWDDFGDLADRLDYLATMATRP